MTKWITSFLILLLAGALAFCPALAENIASFGSADSVRPDITGSFPSASLEENDVLVTENDTLAMYVNEESKLFKILDKRNGYIFTSGRNDEAVEAISRKWKAFAVSPLTADFITLSNMNSASATPAQENIQMEILTNGVKYTVFFPEESTTIPLYVTLDGDGLIAEIPNEEIICLDSNTRLNKVTVLPFLGAAFVGEGEGYIFMPDGAGALIRFDSPKASRALSLRAYGRDRSLLAIGEKMDQLSKLPVKFAEQASLPVLGIAHGNRQNAIVLWAEQGDIYCELIASPAGNNNLTCYYACMQVLYNEMYQQPSSGSDSFTMVQSTMNEVNLRLRYTFLADDEATYIGMANAYRDYLEANDLISNIEYSGQQDIPMLLDCLMEESVKALIGTQNQVMSRYEDVKGWAEMLLENGVENLILSLEGTARGGFSRSKYDDMRSDPALGDINVLDSLKEKGITILMNRSFLKFYESQLPQSQRSYSITRRFITNTEYVYLDSEAYYMRLGRLTYLVGKVLENPQNGVASDDLGKYLFAGYQSPEDYTRGQAWEMLTDAMKTLSDAGVLALSLPNTYALPYIDYAYDLPLSHSAMTFETDAVPFLQIVLSGSVPTFSRSYAAGGSSQKTLLRMVDFNLYPHYTMTEEPSVLLNKSNSSNLFSTQAENLLTGAVEEYTWLNSLLGPVRGQRIVDRRIPQSGLSVVTYESGTRILVNYNEEACQYEGHTVEGLSAVLIEGGEAQ